GHATARALAGRRGGRHLRQRTRRQRRGAGDGNEYLGLVTLPTASPQGGDTGQQEIPFPPAPIEELLRLFVKAVRAHQLYLPNNPVYKGAIEAMRAGFAPIWQHTEDFALRFTETEIRWYDRPVLLEESKSADSLPWTFF